MLLASVFWSAWNAVFSTYPRPRAARKNLRRERPNQVRVRGRARIRSNIRPWPRSVASSWERLEAGGRKKQIETFQFWQILDVQDTGIGIPADRLEHIYEPFFQVSCGKTREFGGAGLGLAIVKSLVDEMHGTIEVESRLGKGTRFRVTIPDIIGPATAPL